MKAPGADGTLAVVGLGYVGLPLAVAFAECFRTIGFDLSERKIAAYRAGNDPTGEIGTERLKAAKRLTVTSDAPISPPAAARKSASHPKAPFAAVSPA